MQSDPVLVLLSGAAVAAVLTVGGGLYGAWIQSRREHSRWIREQRLAAYWDLLRIADSHPGGNGDDDAFQAYLAEYQNALGRIFLVGTKVSAEAAGAHWNAAGALQFAIAEGADEPRIEAAIQRQLFTRTAFLATVRSELRIRD